VISTRASRYSSAAQVGDTLFCGPMDTRLVDALRQRGTIPRPGRLARAAFAARSLETIHFGPEYSERDRSLKRAANGEMEMNAQATKLQAVENDLKQLMADVTRAMEKAQEAVAKIASKTATVTTETEPTTSSCQSEPS
jgi:hypothetical protein